MKSWKLWNFAWSIYASCLTMFNHAHNLTACVSYKAGQNGPVARKWWGDSSTWLEYLVSPVGMWFFFFSFPFFSATVTLWRLHISNRDRQRGDFGAQPCCTEWPAESDTCVVELQRLGPLVPRRGWGRESRCTPIAAFLILFPVSFVLFAQPHTLRLSRPLLAVCQRTWLAASLC